jgi:Protein of unknown function (DUF3011)
MYRADTFLSCLIVILMASLVAVTSVPASEPDAGTTTVHCSSDDGLRRHCPADTSAGVTLSRSIGEGVCLLGKTWGYDDAGIWVTDGCAAEFVVAGDGANEVPPTSEAAEDSTDSTEPDKTGKKPIESSNERETWGVLDPGEGFLIGRGKFGEAHISAYALVRYLNQTPAHQTFKDHLGRERPVDTREDFYAHRALVWLDGWVGDPRLRYTIAWWTVNTTDQDALFGNLGFLFDKKFNLFAGIMGNPGSRSMQGSHPYWLGHDRVLADEYFRPFFAQGVWAQGEVLPGLWYKASVGNSSSTLGVTASSLDRDFTYGGSVWWMPTTHEFGPRGSYGDWEYHDKLATRFGISSVYSPEQRYTDIDEDPDNTVIRLADSVNVFETGSLEPGVTITDLDYQNIAMDVGFKYKGIFVQAEYFFRRLDNFDADGSLPVSKIDDHGFYVQAAFFPIPHTLEIYGATSQIYGDSSAGFGNSSEYIFGLNWYLFKSRNYRVNLQVIDINRSPVSSTFGYYTGGQDGTTYSVAASIFF